MRTMKREPKKDSPPRTALRFKTLNKKAAAILRDGGIGIVPTDTIYGIVGSALMPKTVEAIYSLRRRNKKKPLIVLIGSISDLKEFGVVLHSTVKAILNEVWPAKVSVILPLAGRKFEYLHRGSGGVAFRLPAKADLRRFLRMTGPLVAPSANIEGEPAAKNINEARAYFGDKPDFYVSAGRLAAEPSRLIRINEGKIDILR